MIKFQAHFKSLGCRGEIQVLHESESHATQAISDCVQLIKRFNDKYTRYDPSSIISKINSQAGLGPVEVDKETEKLFNIAAALYEQSGGLFDITSGVLRKAWSFHRNTVPSHQELAPLLVKIGWDKVQWDAPHIFLPDAGMELDLGGFGKEYIIDQAAEFLISRQIKSGLINMGGDIRILGPLPSKRPWQVGIAHPENPSTAFTTISVESGSIATSGDYERYFIKSCKRYSHILNPKTGMPTFGLRAVTVQAISCLHAGTVATMALLMEQSEAIQFLRSSAVRYLSISDNLRVESTL